MYIEPKPPCEILYPIDEWSSKKVYVVSELPSITQLKEWTRSKKGKVYRNKTTMVHTAGRYSETYIKEYRISHTTGDKVHLPSEYAAARKAAQELTQIEDIGWTPGKIARGISSWLGMWQSPTRERARLILPEYNYYLCLPGRSTNGSLWDMTSAYWQVAKRIPSPRVCFTTSATTPLLFGSISPDQERRWREMLKTMEPYKSVRLAMIGQYVSGWKECSNDHPDDGPYQDVSNWHIANGKIVRTPALYGPLNAFGLLVVRCVYELCQYQSELMGGCHAYVDGFVSTGTSDRCEYWDNLGIKYKAKAHGEVDIVSLSKRRIGDYSTKAYRDNISARDIYISRRPEYSGHTWHTEAYHGRKINPQLFYHPLFMR